MKHELDVAYRCRRVFYKNVRFYSKHICDNCLPERRQFHGIHIDQTFDDDWAQWEEQRRQCGQHDAQMRTGAWSQWIGHFGECRPQPMMAAAIDQLVQFQMFRHFAVMASRRLTVDLLFTVVASSPMVEHHWNWTMNIHIFTLLFSLVGRNDVPKMFSFTNYMCLLIVQHRSSIQTVLQLKHPI